MDSEKDHKSLGEDFEMRSGGGVKGPEEPMLPVVQPASTSEKQSQIQDKTGLHPAAYVATWITLSSTVILFNKYILATAGFPYPIVLTSWHLAFATLATQLLARFTTLLDSRKKVPMNGHIYLRKIVPIGLMFSLSLICGNLTYLYLSVSFIQMLKATMPVVTLLVSWSFGVTPPSLQTLGNVSLIVVGVMIASFGEIQFVLIGFLYQCGGILFEACRLVMVQQLLSGSEFKMDPLVSLYYFAPVCAVMNGVIALVAEVPRISLEDIENVGIFILLLNGLIAFLLNVSVVFLIGKTSSLVMTLCGVLKDILLVVASVLLFRDPVSPLQAFGYSIAIAGLLYYKLGATALKDHVATARRSWAEYGAKRPVQRKVLVLVLLLAVLVGLVVAVSGFGAFPEGRDPVVRAKSWLWDLLGQSGEEVFGEGGVEVDDAVMDY